MFSLNYSVFIFCNQLSLLVGIQSTYQLWLMEAKRTAYYNLRRF